MKKLYEEDDIQAIADAIRTKRNVQLAPVGKMKAGDMAGAIKGIQLGCPINVSVHMQDGKWVRPAEWPDLDAFTYGEDELYMTFDASDRIDDPHCSFTISGAAYTVEINGQTWTKLAGTTFTYAFTQADGTYPLVHVKAEGHIAAFYFSTYTIDGRTYTARQNSLVERVGDVYNYGNNNAWSTLYLEREKVLRHACTSSSSGLSETWSGCCSLQSLDLSGWNTTGWAVTSLAYTWYSCYSLQSLDLSGWDTTGWAVTSLTQTWYCCYSLQSLDLSSWDTTGWAVKDLQRTFTSMISLRSLDVSAIDMSKITSWGNSSYPSATHRMITTFKCGESNYGKFAPTSYVYLNISLSNMLTRESLLEFGKMLGTVTTKHYLVMGSMLSNKLTTEEKAEITAKGWTIS